MTEAAGWVGARLLLKRLRDLMAGSGAAQHRLDEIVRLIAADMVAEVCSAYVLRAGEMLELFATQGLNPEAVHKTRLRLGEGLIGDIAAHARPLALADAWSHPNFVYRPETGEDVYRSLMGVPMLRGGRVIGVLAVQNQTMRSFDEEEVETLETIAMVVAELIASGELVNADEITPTGDSIMAPSRHEGVRLNPGLAIGRAVLHQPRIVIRQMIAEDPEHERGRLNLAVGRVQSAIDEILASDTFAVADESREIIESYRMFAEDRGWLARMREAVRSGLTAEAAVQKVQNDMRARMRDITDPYLKDRLLDLQDLTNRLLTQLSGPVAAAAADLPDECVLVARSMGPSELLDYDRRKLRGLVLEEGSPTSHIAIIARAFDIPVVGRVAGVLDRIEPGDLVVIDGDHGQIFIRPGEDIVQTVRETMRVRVAQRTSYAALRDQPPTTRDGRRIRLLINAGLIHDVAALDETGADGIGLFRTEIPFMVRASFPNVAQQVDIYRQVLDGAGGRPVTFRTLDAGGDKLLPYFAAEADANPAMGWRAIRMGLDQPAMLRQQLRALIRAADGRALSIMFPMVAAVAEFKTARALVDLELDRSAQAGEPTPCAVKVGAMVEVPALLWQLPALLAAVDFLSVGSNDLLQFMFASDRASLRIADRYDPLAPPFLTMLRDLVRGAGDADVPITLCGEMAGRPLEAMALIGLGFQTLSMSPGSIGRVKQMIMSLDADALAKFLEGALDSTGHSLRRKLAAYAQDRGIAV